MADKPTKKELQKRAAEDLAKKLQLEEFLRADMIGFFKKISSAAKLLYGSTGRTLSVIQYRADLQTILEKHYRRVIKEFQNPMRVSMDEILGKAAPDDGDDDLDDDDQQYVDNNSHKQAMIILTTTQNRLESSINQAKVDQHTDITEAQTDAQAAQAGASSSSSAGAETTAQQQQDAQQAAQQTASQNNSIVAQNFTDDFDADSESSADMIATTETQITAETAKQNAVNSGISGSGSVAAATAIAATTNKSWHGMLDSKEREWHVEAEGQTQKLTDPFVVNGEMMMYPGDASMGASPDNFINCRCSAQYF